MFMKLLSERIIKSAIKRDKTVKIGREENSQKLFPKTGCFAVKWEFGSADDKHGVMSKTKFEEMAIKRGGLNDEEKKLLEGVDNGNLKITKENSGFVLNLLWALGLGNKNEILEKGPMNDEKMAGAGNFASTGGWTLSRGNAMSHYSMHQVYSFDSAQLTLVEKVSKGIFRPCCGNSTYFPDCNHGMAMLGLLELMASQEYRKMKCIKWLWR